MRNKLFSLHGLRVKFRKLIKSVLVNLWYNNTLKKFESTQIRFVIQNKFNELLITFLIMFPSNETQKSTCLTLCLFVVTNQFILQL